MTLDQYLKDNIDTTLLIILSIENRSFEYRLWNWLTDIKEFRLIKEDSTIGHILHTTENFLVLNDDGSIDYTSDINPKKCVLNFYFGGINK